MTSHMKEGNRGEKESKQVAAATHLATLDSTANARDNPRDETGARLAHELSGSALEGSQQGA